jgi:neutral trehalase
MEEIVQSRAEAVARRREPWREEKEDRNSTEAPWLWSEDAYYFTATKKKRKKKKKTFGETTTTTTTIFHEFACSHQRDIRLKATTLSSTKSRILASTTTTDAGTLQSRLPCPIR